MINREQALKLTEYIESDDFYEESIIKIDKNDSSFDIDLSEQHLIAGSGYGTCSGVKNILLQCYTYLQSYPICNPNLGLHCFLTFSYNTINSELISLF